MTFTIPADQPALFKIIGSGRMFALRPIFLPEDTQMVQVDQPALFDLSEWAQWWGNYETPMMLCPHCHHITAYPVAGGVLCEHNDHGYRVAHAYPKAYCSGCDATFAFIYCDDDDLWEPEMGSISSQSQAGESLAPGLAQGVRE